MYETQTRAKLLAVARKLFAERGYKGTSIRAITDRAGANLGAVTYHFGSKQKLFHEVLTGLWAPIIDEVELSAHTTGTPLERIESVVRTLFAALGRNRDMAAFMLHGILLRGPVPPPVRDRLRRVFVILSSLIQEGQAKGEITAGSPQLLTLSVMAQPAHITVVRSRLKEMLGVGTDDTEMFARIVDNAVRFIRRGLSAQEKII
jgi:AcrR family transcriptional regulator